MVSKIKKKIPKKYFLMWFMFLALAGVVGYIVSGNFIGIIYEETKQPNGNITEFTFILPPEQQNYDIIFSVDYGCESMGGIIDGRIISPTGKEYLSSKITYSVSRTGVGKCTYIGGIYEHLIRDVKQEDGFFRATITQNNTYEKIKTVTLKVKK